MPINENMVQEIVQEVMAKMQIADAPTGKHGIFKEMNDAIEATNSASDLSDVPAAGWESPPPTKSY